MLRYLLSLTLLVSLFNVTACTTRQDELEDSLSVNAQLDTYGDLDVDGESYPWIDGGEDVTSQFIGTPETQVSTREYTKTTSHKKKKR